MFNHLPELGILTVCYTMLVFIAYFGVGFGLASSLIVALVVMVAGGTMVYFLQ